MNKFILHTILFTVLLLVINIALYFAGQNLYFDKYSKLKLNYKSYILADSHGLPLSDFTEKYGIYNFSAGSDSYFDMHRKMKYLIRNTKVDTIYIIVDDHTLSPYREKSDNRDRSIIYCIPSDFNSFYDYIINRYIKHYIFLFQPKTRTILKQYIFAKLNIIISSKECTGGNGISWSEMKTNERITHSIKRFEDQFSATENSPSLEQALLNIISACKQNDIILIGIKFPLSFEYIETIGNKTYNADVIMRENGLNVLDFKKVFADREEYFKNQDHLNKEGGRKLTELLFEAKNH